MIVCIETKSGWHATTQETLLAYGMPSKAALLAEISRKVDSLPDDFEIVSAPLEIWLPTYRSAIGRDSLGAQSAIERLEATVEVERLHSRLSLLLTATADLESTIQESVRTQAETLEFAKQQAAIQQQEREKQAAESAAIEQAKAERQQAELMAAERARDRRYQLLPDGSIEVTDNANNDRYRSARKIVARYAPGTAPPEIVELARAAK